MKEYSKWQDKEIKELFLVVEKYKQKNASLLAAFSEYAKISGRKRNSVRNYYYQELAELQKNKIRAAKLNININNHTITNSVLFSNEETKEILTKILTYNSLGYSIRKACLLLADNDINKMVRYQNKYRSVLKNDPQLIEKIKSEISSKENKQQSKSLPNNVVYFKKQDQKKLSDNDINSLFLGLIKLVKKSAAENIEKKIMEDLECSNSTLRKTLIKLTKAEQDICDLSEKMKSQSLELEKVKIENMYLRTELADLLNKKKNQTQKSLSSFLKEVKQKQNANAN